MSTSGYSFNCAIAANTTGKSRFEGAPPRKLDLPLKKWEHCILQV